MNIAVIIAAAGASTRMGGGSKVLLPLAGRPVLEHSLRLFSRTPAVSRILIAARVADMAEVRHICLSYPKAQVIPGGPDRASSVARALAALADATDLTHIAVHDGARPLLHEEDWQALLAAAEGGEQAVLPACPLVDSIKQVERGKVARGLAREGLAAAQTPQLFAASLLRLAYARAVAEGTRATDDAELAQQVGAQPAIVWSRHENFKLTYAGDLERAELVLAKRGPASSLSSSLSSSMSSSMSSAMTSALPACRFSVGQGWDSHRLSEGRPLILGGVEIPFERGLLGVSDGDALTHAIIDALLGAASLPDIGRQFPDTDPAYLGISSLTLLGRSLELIHRSGWQVRHIDATVMAERPKLAPHIDKIRQSLACALSLPLTAVSLKAKTAEGLDSVGQGLAMQAMAIALLERSGS